jgi:hypothetical protein
MLDAAAGKTRTLFSIERRKVTNQRLEKDTSRERQRAG